MNNLYYNKVQLFGISSAKTLEFQKYNLKHDVVVNDAVYIPFGDIPVDNNITTKNIYLH